MFNLKQKKILDDLKFSKISSFKSISKQNVSKEFILACIEVNANLVLQNFPHDCLTLNQEIAEAMLERNKFLIEDIPARFITKEMALYAVEHSALLIDSIPLDILDKEICLVAVSKNGGMLRRIPDELKDENMCFLAIRDDASAIHFTPCSIKDEAFKKKAVEINSDVRSYIKVIN